MEQLWAWLKAITALVIILGFLETILPESAGLRGTAKLVFGIVLMAAVLQPVLELVHLDWKAISIVGQRSRKCLFDQFLCLR